MFHVISCKVDVVGIIFYTCSPQSAFLPEALRGLAAALSCAFVDRIWYTPLRYQSHHKHKLRSTETVTVGTRVVSTIKMTVVIRSFLP